MRSILPLRYALLHQSLTCVRQNRFAAMSKAGQAVTSDLSPASLFSTKDWICVVSGGGTGIGLMGAQALVAAGASKVYILGRRLEALETAAQEHGQGKFIPKQCDIVDISSLKRVAQEIEKEDGHVDLLLNNAGISGPKHNVDKGDDSAEALQKELLKDSIDEWRQVMDINVHGHYYTSVAFLHLLANATKKRPGFSAGIININSISGITNTTQHHIPYNVSKAAGRQLVVMMAQEFSRDGVKVRVNGINPGIFPSEMTADASDDKNKSHIDSKGYKEQKHIKAGRPGRDADMANVVLSLATNMYMTGSEVVIDGGYLLGNP